MSSPDDPRGQRPESAGGPGEAPDAVPDAAPDDEIASALLDGEAGPEEQARSSEAGVAARIAAFRRVAGQVGAPVPPVDATARDRAVAAALDAWGTAAPEDETLVAPVAPRRDELAAVRRRRAARHGAGLRLAGVAAAVLAVLAVGAVALQGGDDDEDTAAESADTALEERAGAGASSGGAASPPAADAGGTSAGQSRADLGEFADLDALVEFAGSLPLSSTTAQVEDESGEDDTALAPPAAAAPCAEATERQAAGLTPLAFAAATLDGRPVLVVVTDDPDVADGARVQVYDATTCALIADRTLG